MHAYRYRAIALIVSGLIALHLAAAFTGLFYLVLIAAGTGYFLGRRKTRRPVTREREPGLRLVPDPDPDPDPDPGPVPDAERQDSEDEDYGHDTRQRILSAPLSGAHDLYGRRSS